MRSKLFSFAALALACTCPAFAQPMEPPAPGQIGLTLRTSGTVSGKGDIKDDRNTCYRDLRASHFSMELNQQIPLGKMRRLGLGLDYETTAIDKPDQTRIPFPEQLKNLGASVRYFQMFNPQWMFSASIGAGSYVTDTGLLSEGWGTRATAIGIYNHSHELTLLFGVAHNSLSEDFKLIPVFGLDWRPAPKWSIVVGFPRIAATYKLNEQLKFGLGLSGTGGAYYVKRDPLPGVADRSLDGSRLQHLELRLGFNCDWKINNTLRLSASVGQVLLRRLKYIDRDFELKSDNLTPFASFAGIVAF